MQFVEAMVRKIGVHTPTPTPFCGNTAKSRNRDSKNKITTLRITHYLPYSILPPLAVGQVQGSSPVRMTSSATIAQNMKTLQNHLYLAGPETLHLLNDL